MKILQIASPWLDTPPKDYGGTEWVIANLVKGLSDLGHSVTLFATKTSKATSNPKYLFKKSLLAQGISWTAGLPAFLHFYEAFKEAFKYDVVHAHIASSTDLMVMPFLADLTEQGIPNVMTIHSRWSYDKLSHMDKTFIKLYAKKILAVNISKSMHKTLPKGFRDGGFVYNSLDASKMKFSPKGGKYLTWLGKIVPEKGTAEAIKIAKAAGEQLIFAGIIDVCYEKSVKYWKEKVKPLIDGKQIQFLGPANLRLKNKMLGGAKAFLNPLKWDEPFGMVMIESMAVGTPVISISRGAASEVIKNNQTGFLVSSKQGMIKVIKRVGEIDRRACRQHVEDNFSPYRAALQYLKIYRRQMHLPINGHIRQQTPILAAKTSSVFIPEPPPKKNLFIITARDTLDS